MLILSRAKGQEILIGENIRIVVVELDNAHVRLGFDAPRDVQIVRPDAKKKESRKWQP